jgi:plastocyanin
MFKKKQGLFLAVLLFTAAIFTGCSAINSSASDVQEVVITAKNMSFEPNTVTVEKGTKVKLTLKNEEDMMNNLVIQGTDIKIDNVEPKQEKSIEFVADRQGTFQMVSTVSGMQSMSGQFIVK